MAVVIRLAESTDASALLAIYSNYISRSVTFETALPSEEEFKRRIKEVREFYPYLLCEKDGQIVGYAYAHRFKERRAYDWSAETSIYLAPEACGQGLGKMLYGALLELLALQNIQTAYACVTVPNIPSERLHLSLGFRLVAQLPKVGYKVGAWHDVKYFAKQIGTYPASPAAIISLREVDNSLRDDILRKAAEQWQTKLNFKK